MLALFILACLADQPDICAERMVPVACSESQARDWIAARANLALADWRCDRITARIEPLPVIEVAPGLYVHTGRHELADAQNAGDLANIGFVIGDAGVAVIDAGGSREVGERLLAAVREQTSLHIDWLVLTHMHPDHILGASVFRDAGARVIAHARFPDALGARADPYMDSLRREVGDAHTIGSEIVFPDETVQDLRHIDLGNRRLTLEAHPVAHTDNDLSVLDEATGIWWLSDLVFDEHLPSIDGSGPGWLALLEVLADRPVEQVIPGHGGPLLPWPEGAGPMRAYLQALATQTRAALDRGESLSVAVQHLGQDLRGDWHLFDAFNTRNATAFYLELEWE
jgi:quinoprotein relay system zinc metallohydrolase 2